MPWRRVAYPPPVTQFDPEEGRVILRDGTTAYLRPLRPDDRELVRAFLRRLSPETLRRRFLAPVRPESERAVAALLGTGDPESTFSLGVFHGPPEDPRLIAVGTYAPLPADPETAEVAFLVDDAYRGRGLGTLLLERLALVAVRQGIRRFTALTEPDNRDMRAVFRASGFPVREHAEQGTLTVSFSVVPDAESVARFEWRDHVATVASLRPFFHPRAVAVVGASRDPEALGFRVLENLVRGRFRGPVYPVNPFADAVGPFPCYRSVLDVPGPVDLAVLAVPRHAVLEAAEQCGRKGVRALVVIAAGFAEAGPEGEALQRRLVRLVHGYGMRLLGPNSLGIVHNHPDVRLNASLGPAVPPPGRIAMASQSGALGIAVLEYLQELGLGLSAYVSLGNKADVSSNDLIQYWQDDPGTDVIVLYLESFGNPRRFARLARAVGRRKPILVVKAGRTRAGLRAAAPHTAAAPASEVAVDALCRQAGIVRAETLEELFEAAALLAHQPLPPGPRVAVVTNSGGPAILCADACEARGLEVPPLPLELRRRLEPLAASPAAAANPVDLGAAAGPDAYRAAVETLLADPRVDALIAIYVPLGRGSPEAVAAAIREGVARAREAGGEGKPVLACFMGRHGLPGPLAGDGSVIPSYRFPESAARALAHAYRYACWRREPPGVVPDFPEMDLRQARRLCREGGGWLDPQRVAELLAAAALPAEPARLVVDPEAAAAAARELGFPVVVKRASDRPGTRRGQGVLAGLADEEAVREACARLQAGGGPGGRLLVQRHLEGGIDVRVEVREDPLFGPLIGFGLAGPIGEALGEPAFRMVPLTDVDAGEMVRGARGAALLLGGHGAPAADLPALEELLLRVSRLVEEVPALQELHLDPVRAFPAGQGCRILDAYARVRERVAGAGR